MGSKGSNTTTTSQNQTYTPAGGSYIQNALDRAGQAANQPFNIPQAPVAGFSQDQMSAFRNVNNAQGMAQPYINQANNYFQQSAQRPDVASFYNPMAANVTAQLQNIFGQQNSQNTGQLTQAAGGVGADRIAVGQANLANQQGLAAGQTYAGLWQQAQQAAAQQQGALQSAGYGTAALGSQAQNAALSGAQAQLATGGLQQQLQQAQLNSPYQQQLAQAAFPYQQAQFLAGITGSLAPGLGGTTQGTGSQTSPAPSIWSQILGGGTAAAGLAGQFGAFNGPSATDSYGGGSAAAGDAYGGSAASPLPGLSASDYGGSPFSTAFGKGSGGRVPYAEGGEVSDRPIDIEPQSIIPQVQPPAAIQPHIPQLNLTPQQPQGGGGGSGAGDIAKIAQMAMMFMARGGAAKSPYNFHEHRFPQGYAEGGAPEMSEADQAAMMPETYANPLVKQRMGDLMSLPQRAIDAAGQDFAHFGEDGYEPQAIGPAMETALRMVGTGAPFAQRGALGASGGKPTAASVFPEGYYEKIPQEMRLSRKGVSHPGIRWEVFDPKTGTVMRKDLTTRSGANSAVDRLDNKYGAYRYQVRPVRAKQLTEDEAKILTEKGIKFERGGRAFADGGGDTLDLEDRFGPVKDALANGDFDAQGMNSTTFDPFTPAKRGLPPIITNGTQGTPTATPTRQAMSFAPEAGADEGAPAAAPAAPAADPEPPSSSPYNSDSSGLASSPWAALTAAGLGIMGGTSPYAGVNIGQGAQQGLKMLENQRAASQKDTTIQQSADRLAQEARFHEDAYKRIPLYQQKQLERQKDQDDLAWEKFDRPYNQLTKEQQLTLDRQQRQDDLAQQRFDRPYKELTAAEKAQLEESKRQHDLARLPQGFQYKTDEQGNIIGQEPVPGGPHSPDQIRAEADAKRLPAMSDEDLKPLIETYRAGNTMGVLASISRGTQGSQNVQRFWHLLAEDLTKEGASGKDLAAARANFMAQSAGLRVAAQREAQIETAVNEAKGTFPEVLRTSALLPRGEFTPVNQALEFARSKTGSTAQRAYGAAIQSAITAYSQAMNRTGANSVFAQQHAEGLLAKADGPKAIKATIDQLGIEMEIAQRAPEQTRQAILNRILGIKTDGAQPPPAAAPAAAAPAAAAPAAAAPAAPAVVRPPSLPEGSQYSPSRKMWRTPDGKMFDASGQPVVQ